MAFRRALHLYQPARFVHDDVHVGLRFRVLGVVEVENRPPAIDADRNGSDLPVHGVRFELPGLEERVPCQPQRNVGSAYRCGTCTSVRLQHIAIQGYSALAKRFQVDCGPERTPDQALDFHGAPALPPTRRFPSGTKMRRPRQHAVFAGNPATPGAPHPRWNAGLDRRGAENPGVAELCRAAAFGVVGEVRAEEHRSHLVVRAAAWSHGRTPRWIVPNDKATVGTRDAAKLAEATFLVPA